jgi:hypothetical protein
LFGVSNGGLDDDFAAGAGHGIGRKGHAGHPGRNKGLDEHRQPDGLDGDAVLAAVFLGFSRKGGGPTAPDTDFDHLARDA